MASVSDVEWESISTDHVETSNEIDKVLRCILDGESFGQDECKVNESLVMNQTFIVSAHSIAGFPPQR